MARNRGFTLIELLVVVAISGVFMAAAKPFYNQYQVNVARGHVQGELLNIAEKMQTYYLLNSTYAGLNPLGAGNTKQFPIDQPLYTIALTVPAGGQTFRLQATPLSNKVVSRDGMLCLNHLMHRNWLKGIAPTCEPNATTGWYGDS